MSQRTLLASAVRYGGVGVINTIIGLAVIAGLTLGLGVQPNLANAAGYAVGVCVSFVLSRLFVFGAQRSLRSASPRYVLAVAAAFLLNQAVLTLARRLLPPGDVSAMAAQVAAIGSYTVALFLMSHYWVFAAERPAEVSRPRPIMDWAIAIVVIGATALFLMWPTWPGGLHWSDSHTFNAVWVPEFNAALARGEFIPRWLPGAFMGLGASSFYFYPPLAFYVAAAVNAVTSGGLATDQVITVAETVMLGLSGLAMFAWLRSQAALIWAIAGALLYMAAPYHLANIYIRGSFAEASAYMALPLMMLALQRAARDWRWVPALGLAYALLICAHIGSALLVTLVAIPPYVVLLWLQAAPDQRMRTVLRCLCGGVLGLSLAAFYLAPAIFLQSSAQLDTMWIYPPGDWALLQPGRWKVRPLADCLAMLAWTAAGVSLISAIVARRDAVFRPVLAAGAIVLIGVGLYATSVPWSLPVLGSLLSTVQFPWRLLIVVDFAAISALIAATRARRSAWLLLALPLGLLPVQAVRLMKPAVTYVLVPGAEPDFAKRQVAIGMAPGEHLPKGYVWEAGLADALTHTAAVTPQVAIQDPGARVLAVKNHADGVMDITVDAPRPTRLVARRFYFPAWRASAISPDHAPSLPVTAYSEHQLVSFVVPAGQATYRLKIVPTSLERVGYALSLIGLLAVAGIFAATRRRSVAEA